MSWLAFLPQPRREEFFLTHPGPDCPVHLPPRLPEPAEEERAPERSTRMALAMELYPKGSAGDGEGEADFRIRQGGKAWTYLEVADPDLSEQRSRPERV